MLVDQTMGSLQKLTLGIDVAKNHAIMWCCQAVMAPAGPVGGEASKMSPFCGRPGVWKVGVFPPLGASEKWKNGLWVVLGVFPGNAKTKTHERTRKMEGFRSVGMSNHRKLAETNAWDRR